jgi:deoxyribonuclease-4
MSNAVRIGAHVSASGGIHKVFSRAHAIGAQAIQMFGSSPMQWKAALPTKEAVEQFMQERKRYDIGPVFLHAPYLINLSSPKKQLRAMSRELLKKQLLISNALGADGVIFHVGSRGDQSQEEGVAYAAEALKRIFDEVDDGMLLVENSAGSGNLVGDTLEEIGAIVREVNNNRLGFCYDTAHGFGSGVVMEYTPDTVATLAKNITKEIGKGTLKVVHANDSKVEAGSKKDRHDNIGEGYIGVDGFKALLANPLFSSVPFILEVPGFDGDGPDKKNVMLLQKLSHS